MTHKAFLTFLLAIVTFVFIAPASAQVGGDTKNVRIKKDAINLLPEHFYTVNFFNNPDRSESKFTLRLSSYGVISGCAYMRSSNLEQEVMSDYIKFVVKNSRIKLDTKKPRYTNYDCEVRQNEAYIDIELDRDELIEHGIKKLTLETDKGLEFVPAEIDINKYRLEYRINGPQYTYLRTFWFFPKNTVILMAPSAKQGQDVHELLNEFGKSNGLVLLEDALENYELPYEAMHYALFTDPSRQYVSKLKKTGQFVDVGHITPSRTVYNAQGPYEETYDIPVRAMLPGRYLD